MSPGCCRAAGAQRWLHHPHAWRLIRAAKRSRAWPQVRALCSRGCMQQPGSSPQYAHGPPSHHVSPCIILMAGCGVRGVMCTACPPACMPAHAPETLHTYSTPVCLVSALCPQFKMYFNAAPMLPATLPWQCCAALTLSSQQARCSPNPPVPCSAPQQLGQGTAARARLPLVICY